MLTQALQRSSRPGKGQTSSEHPGSNPFETDPALLQPQFKGVAETGSLCWSQRWCAPEPAGSQPEAHQPGFSSFLHPLRAFSQPKPYTAQQTEQQNVQGSMAVNHISDIPDIPSLLLEQGTQHLVQQTRSQQIPFIPQPIPVWSQQPGGSQQLEEQEVHHVQGGSMLHWELEADMGTQRHTTLNGHPSTAFIEAVPAVSHTVQHPGVSSLADSLTHGGAEMRELLNRQRAAQHAEQRLQRRKHLQPSPLRRQAAGAAAAAAGQGFPSPITLRSEPPSSAASSPEGGGWLGGIAADALQEAGLALGAELRLPPEPQPGQEATRLAGDGPWSPTRPHQQQQQQQQQLSHYYWEVERPDTPTFSRPSALPIPASGIMTAAPTSSSEEGDPPASAHQGPQADAAGHLCAPASAAEPHGTTLISSSTSQGVGSGEMVLEQQPRGLPGTDLRTRLPHLPAAPGAQVGLPGAALSGGQVSSNTAAVAVLPPGAGAALVLTSPRADLRKRLRFEEHTSPRAPTIIPTANTPRTASLAGHTGPFASASMPPVTAPGQQCALEAGPTAGVLHQSTSAPEPCSIDVVPASPDGANNLSALPSCTVLRIPDPSENLSLIHLCPPPTETGTQHLLSTLPADLQLPGNAAPPATGQLATAEAGPIVLKLPESLSEWPVTHPAKHLPCTPAQRWGPDPMTAPPPLSLNAMYGPSPSPSRPAHFSTLPAQQAQLPPESATAAARPIPATTPRHAEMLTLPASKKLLFSPIPGHGGPAVPTPCTAPRPSMRAHLQQYNGHLGGPDAPTPTFSAAVRGAPFSPLFSPAPSPGFAAPPPGGLMSPAAGPTTWHQQSSRMTPLTMPRPPSQSSRLQFPSTGNIHAPGATGPAAWSEFYAPTASTGGPASTGSSTGSGTTSGGEGLSTGSLSAGGTGGIRGPSPRSHKQGPTVLSPLSLSSARAAAATRKRLRGLDSPYHHHHPPPHAGTGVLGSPSAFAGRGRGGSGSGAPGSSAGHMTGSSTTAQAYGGLGPVSKALKTHSAAAHHHSVQRGNLFGSPRFSAGPSPASRTGSFPAAAAARPQGGMQRGSAYRSLTFPTESEMAPPEGQHPQVTPAAQQHAADQVAAAKVLALNTGSVLVVDEDDVELEIVACDA